jgi:hypothetical protein
MVYYSTFPISSQGLKMDWNYELKAVYTIAILDFVFDEDKDEPNKYRYDIKLSDVESNKVFYNKLTYIYLEMKAIFSVLLLLFHLTQCSLLKENGLYIISPDNNFEVIEQVFLEESVILIGVSLSNIVIINII